MLYTGVYRHEKARGLGYPGNPDSLRKWLLMMCPCACFDVTTGYVLLGVDC